MAETSKMKIRSIAPWYGSKRTIAPIIVDLMGKHSNYWEPFCGSMAVLMAKPVCRMETANDMHGDLINLARVIQCPDLGERFYDKLKRTLCAEQFFMESRDRWRSSPPPFEDMDIERAYDYFVASWMGLNGVSGTARCNYQLALRWCGGGGQGAARWRSAIDSIPAWHQRLRNVLIIKRDAFDVVDNIKDEADTVIYCDPPYIEKSDKYLHDFDDANLFTIGGHKRLSRSLARFENAQVIVSYYDHPDLADLYADWIKIKIKKTSQSLRNATRGDKKKPAADRTEVLLINRESKTKVGR